MSINDSNPGCILYNYSTQKLLEVDCSEEIPVGVGLDGIPFSGDEAKLKAIPKPEIEIYGDSTNTTILVNANNSTITHISVFGSLSNTYPGGINSTGKNNVFSEILSGLRANGSDPKLSGLNRTGGAGFWIEGNNNTVKNSIVAFTERYGLLFCTTNVNSGLAVNVISYRNALIFSGGDNIGVESSASGVRIENCLSSRASGNGIETWRSGGDIEVYNCTVEYNGIGNESGYVSERVGIRINANSTEIQHSLIRNNGQGVIITNYYSGATDNKRLIYNASLRFNSIYNNSFLGIDIVDTSNSSVARKGDNVTLNDGQLNCSQPNCGVDYPVITYAECNGTQLYVEGFIGDSSGSGAFANTIVNVYLVKNSSGGDNLIGNNYSAQHHSTNIMARDGSTSDLLRLMRTENSAVP